MWKIKHKETHKIYSSGSLSMWELHPLVATADFHNDEKRVQEYKRISKCFTL